MRKTALLVSTAVAALLLPVAASGSVSSAHGTMSQEAHSDHGGNADSSLLTPKQERKLTPKIAAARAATAKYATNLDAAKSDGYNMMITQMMPNMGYHFLNPNSTDFDVTRPPILVYEKNGDDWQLSAFEWVFTEKPATKPLPGAKYGSFPAACHYEDGTFEFKSSESECSDTSPTSGAAFSFWHPDLVTLHVWAWYPNPDGLYSGTNPWVAPFNDGSV
ncbi:MAG: hypothetical protein ABR579_05745 [Actinomycetota bacterium]